MNDSILIHKLTLQVNNLQMSFDTLKVNSSIRQLTYELHQKQDVISQINSFYESAWLKLIIVISVLGVLVPIIAQYFQRRNLRDLTEFIRNQMNDSFDLKLEELKIYNKQEIDKSLNELNANIKAIENKNQYFLKEFDASTFYLQGRSSLLGKEYVNAINSFLKSADLYLQSERPERATVLFVNLKLCLKAVNDKNIIILVDQTLLKSSYKCTLDDLIKHFRTYALSTLDTNHIVEIEKELKRIKNGA